MITRRFRSRRSSSWPFALLVLLLVTAMGSAAIGAGPALAKKHKHKPKPPQGQQLQLALSASQDVLVAEDGCMPGGTIEVTVALTTDQVGFDSFTIRGRNLVPNQDYTIFLLETAGPPFGAAQYIGDLTTDKQGNGQNTLKLIVEEAFASANGDPATIIQLNRLGVWFADPAGDDGCLGANGIDAATIFDGDAEAGIQAFNSGNAAPLP